MIERGSEQQSDPTPEQEQQRFSPGGLSFEESVRRVGVASTSVDLGDHEGEERMGMAPGYLDRDLTDEELVQVWESTTAGVSNGTLPTFSDRAAFMQDVLRRLRR